MPYQNRVFIWLNQAFRPRKGKVNGQIATLILLFIAVLFLLTAVVINLGKIAQRKTTVVNAATGATLSLASSLGSYAHLLSCKYLGCKAKKCKISWLNIVMVVVAIALIVTVVVASVAAGGLVAGLNSIGASIAGALGATTAGAAAVATVAFAVTTALSVVSLGLKLAVFDPQMLSAMNSAFKKMNTSTQFGESAVQYAFMNTVDDQVKVADMNDLDMDDKYGLDANGNPVDLINRFSYKYTQRLMWLSDSGPGPDGQYRNYKKRLIAIIQHFKGHLRTFNTAVQNFTTYVYRSRDTITQLPTDTNPLTPVFDLWQPSRINSLYTLFAYLREQEYPRSHKLMYNLGQPTNIWTNGIATCAEQYSCGGDGCAFDAGEEPDDPCQNDIRNDELDTLAYDLSEFSTPGTGFAPGILASTDEDLFVSFENWYGQLYSECDDETVNADGSCSNPDYSDYYDLTWQVPDDEATMNLVEKGWNQAIADWLTRLRTMETDLNRRSRVHCGHHDHSCRVERSRVRQLLSKVRDAISRLNTFRRTIPAFRNAILDLHNGYEALRDENPYSGSDIEDYALYDTRSPTYIWHDSLGRHSVRVEVSDFKLARLKAYRPNPFVYCIKLLNNSGTVSIRVTRADEPTNARLPGGIGLLWKFRYPTISYRVSVRYSYRQEPPTVSAISR